MGQADTVMGGPAVTGGGTVTGGPTGNETG